MSYAALPNSVALYIECMQYRVIDRKKVYYHAQFPSDDSRFHGLLAYIFVAMHHSLILNGKKAKQMKYFLERNI